MGQTIELQARSRKTRLVCDRGREHFPTDRGVRRLLTGFVRGSRSQDEDHFGEVERLERFTGQDKVAVMNRVETPAINADLFQTQLSRRNIERGRADIPVR